MKSSTAIAIRIDIFNAIKSAADEVGISTGNLRRQIAKMDDQAVDAMSNWLTCSVEKIRTLANDKIRQAYKNCGVEVDEDGNIVTEAE